MALWARLVLHAHPTVVLEHKPKQQMSVWTAEEEAALYYLWQAVYIHD